MSADDELPDVAIRRTFRGREHEVTTHQVLAALRSLQDIRAGRRRYVVIDADTPDEKIIPVTQAVAHALDLDVAYVESRQAWSLLDALGFTMRNQP